MTVWYPRDRSRRRKSLSYNDKVLMRLKENSIIDSKTGCKLWQGTLSHPFGHGKTSFHNRQVYIHRLIMHLLKGFDLDSKEQINHIRECPNPNCWEIEHLYVGNPQNNMDDKSANTTHCRAGHPYSVENTYSWYDKKAKKFRYFCRTCNNESHKCQTT